MNIKATLVTMLIASVAAWTLPGVAAEAVTKSDAAYLQRIEPHYLSTAGSQDNLSSLASGLRSSTPVTLTSINTDGTVSALTFTPPTRPMGYGNITHTLDYASRDLAAAGISSPTSEQLHAALMGGTVTNAAGETTVLPGVLQLRSQGMGWGQIAHNLGIHPSPHAKAGVIAGGAATAKPVTAKSTTSGITTAAGAKTHAGYSSKSAKSGVVTANGGASPAKYSYSNGHGKSGIVTAGGASPGYSGVTRANGNGASASSAAAARVSTAGGGSGNGNAFGKSKH